MAGCYFSPIFIFLAATSAATADIDVNDYIHWKKADISAWHQYFPSRALNEEHLTNDGAVAATLSVSQGLGDSLRRVAWYQAQELDTAQWMMEGTSAQGCVEGISTFMSKAIDDEYSSYKDCAADVVPRLNRASGSLSKIISNYDSAYQKALAGIDSCAKTYPNKDSQTRLKSCVEAWDRNYFTVANATRGYNALVSPAMKIFSAVAECAQTAAQNVVAKGWEFLKKLAYCAKLSENLDAQAYEDQVSTGYSNYLTQNDLTAQIQQAQAQNIKQVNQIENEMLFYYDLQKRALENYVIESRGSGHYFSQVYGYLSGYFSTIGSTSRDNPSNSQCTSAAYSALTSVASSGSAAALACDQNIVTDTKTLLSRVNDKFVGVNDLLPSAGNAAILSCFNQGYIFAEQTILSCFTATASNFAADYGDVHDSVVKDVATLLGYETGFFGNSSLPCGDSVLRRAYAGAGKVLHDLQRCLYVNSGTKYAVTTVAPMVSGS